MANCKKRYVSYSDSVKTEIKTHMRKTVFVDWQILTRPAGLSCTNSPLESFNSSIKRTFTLRKKLSSSILRVC
ncbi:hypothetical protein BpHYR1_032211 [Brachionus plicatilis]|uniref:Transposase n=1 Tax=Brachionus plicatilis TaxID=10195 RepID=A0A3M7Q6U4_BRAPC|nr:hypothetical protein BpHYR1_032211 [Brachionus plicatilis]